MSDNSSSVAIVAIIIILAIGVAVFYFLTNGFQFNKINTTIVQPTVQTGESTGTTKTSTTKTTKTN